jgi:hypothetical protein
VPKGKVVVKSAGSLQHCMSKTGSKRVQNGSKTGPKRVQNGFRRPVFVARDVAHTRSISLVLRHIGITTINVYTSHSTCTCYTATCYIACCTCYTGERDQL